MDLIVLLKELSSTGISDFVIVGVALLVVRYWFSETRREISKEIDDKIDALKSDLEQSVKENREETAALRTETRQEFSEFKAGRVKSSTQSGQIPNRPTKKRGKKSKR